MSASTTITLLVVWLVGKPPSAESVRAFAAATWTQCEEARRKINREEFGSVCIQVPLT